MQTRYADDQFEDNLNTRSLDEYVVWDLTMSKDLREGWNVFVRLENIGDEDVEVGQTGDGLVSIGTPFLVHGGVRVRLRH